PTGCRSSGWPRPPTSSSSTASRPSAWCSPTATRPGRRHQSDRRGVPRSSPLHRREPDLAADALPELRDVRWLPIAGLADDGEVARVLLRGTEGRNLGANE